MRAWNLPALWTLWMCLVLSTIGCEMGPRSGRGLRLPEGDVARGAVAFRDLGCERCHDVVGAPRAPEASAEKIMTLGGEVTRVYSYGELVTSIINPSYHLSRVHLGEKVAEGGVSRMEMERLNDRMTVGQLVDLVAFLQSKYETRRDPGYVQ